MQPYKIISTLVYRIMVHVRLFNFEKLPPYTSLFDTYTVINFLVLILITIDFIHVCKEYQNSNFDIFGKQTFLLPLYFKPRTYHSFGILTTYNLLAPLYAYFKPIRLLNFQKLLSYTLIPSYTIIRQRRVHVSRFEFMWK